MRLTRDTVHSLAGRKLMIMPHETELYAYIETRHPQIFPAISEKKTLDDALKASLNQAVKEFAGDFAARKAAAA